MVTCVRAWVRYSSKKNRPCNTEYTQGVKKENSSPLRALQHGGHRDTGLLNLKHSRRLTNLKMPIEGEPYGSNQAKVDKTPSKTEELIEPGELRAPTQRKKKTSKATNSSKSYLQFPFQNKLIP